MEKTKEIGDTLRRLRLIYGYSAQEMGKELGISNSYLSEIEKGKKRPSLDLLEKYSKIFHMKLSTLMRFSEDYSDADRSGKGQEFITNLMSKLIEAYSEGK